MKTKHLITMAVFGLSTAFAQAQQTECNCPKTKFADTKAKKTFSFSNGKTIALCGHKTTKTKQELYSEFVLSVCGQDSILGFWGATNDYSLKMKSDTLMIEKLRKLPVGKGFAFTTVVWSIEKIYFRNQKAVKRLSVNRQILKYSKEQIAAVLKEFETAKQGLDDNKRIIANKLFIAAISGDKTARAYFGEFKTKFGAIDGALSEEYIELCNMLKQWDKNTSITSIAPKDQSEIRNLIRQTLNWADSKNSIDLLPALTDNEKRIYTGIDLNKHKENISKLIKTDLFTAKFIDNYDRIIQTIDKKLRNKDSGEWRVGELSPFSFANGVDPWTLCQDVPYDKPSPRSQIEIEITNSAKGELVWKWGKPELNPSPQVKSFRYKCRVAKANGKWKIDYLQGFDCGEIGRSK